MVNISLTLYMKGFFGSVLKSHTQMGSLSINNSVTNISRLGTFKDDVTVSILLGVSFKGTELEFLNNLWGLGTEEE
jgi:hypothetical protein